MHWIWQILYHYFIWQLLYSRERSHRDLQFPFYTTLLISTKKCFFLSSVLYKKITCLRSTLFHWMLSMKIYSMFYRFRFIYHRWYRLSSFNTITVFIKVYHCNITSNIKYPPTQWYLRHGNTSKYKGNKGGVCVSVCLCACNQHYGYRRTVAYLATSSFAMTQQWRLQ